MKTIRIGNDIVVTWSLFKEGQPYSLADMDVTLYLSHAFGKTIITDYHVNDNQIVWTFKGKEQQHTGKYSLELVINEAQDGMASTDYCNFVNLAQTTPCCEGEDDDDVVTEYVELTSTVNYAPVVIKEGGGAGLQYATERTVFISEYEVDGESEKFEITEEERAYNVETCKLGHEGKAVVVFFGIILDMVGSSWNDEYGEVHFNVVCEYFGVLWSLIITINSNGDAVYSVKEFETGSAPSTPSDMNSDFSNDF